MVKIHSRFCSNFGSNFDSDYFDYFDYSDSDYFGSVIYYAANETRMEDCELFDGGLQCEFIRTFFSNKGYKDRLFFKNPTDSFLVTDHEFNCN